MKETIDKIIEWAKGNKWLAIAGAGLLTLLFFPKMLRPPRRRRRRTTYAPVTTSRRRRIRVNKTGRPRKQYTKGGKAKKAWQIKGSLAAKRHMARIRKMR